MARRRNSREIDLNFDSFLDVITNCIGVLMVITLLAMINTKYMIFVVRTPFVRHTGKAPVFFECRHNRNVPIDKASIEIKLREYVEEVKENRTDYSRLMQSRIPKLHDVGNRFYMVDLTKLFRENILVLVPKENAQRKRIPGLVPADPQFNQALDKIAPERQFAFFLVRPDSYEVFRETRDILWDKGVEVGWEPLDTDQFISFGTRGRKPAID